MRAPDTWTETADYVVIGAGSAGCVVAARLSETDGVNVLCLEAGADDRPLKKLKHFGKNLAVHVPIGFGTILHDPAMTWGYKTVADAGTGDRVHAWTRAKVLGGCSSINGMVYVRGQQADYDMWRQLGCVGWSYEDVLPFFKANEHHERAAGAYHGSGGSLNVSTPAEMDDVSLAVVDAGASVGLPRNPDYNGEAQEGVGLFDLTVRRGRRCSAAVAYLHPAMRRSNLRVETEAMVTRLLFEGKRAIGVEYRKAGKLHRVRVNREVVLSGGAINSPQLLELSGVGNGDILSSAGVPVVHHLPGVGENLQDHVMLPVLYRVRPGVITVNQRSQGLRLLKEFLLYATQRKGFLSMSAATGYVFCKSRPELEHPDIQFHFFPATVDFKTMAKTSRYTLEKEPGLTLSPSLLRPESRGTIHISSDDPSAHPAIQPNYLSAAEDQRVLIAGIDWARRIAEQPALARYIQAELMPGKDVTSYDDLLAYARETSSSVSHPSGTCRMGIQDDAVVDPRLKVVGIEGVRVADASIMPKLVSGNTNAPCMMIGEKAAAMIKEDALARG